MFIIICICKLNKSKTIEDEVASIYRWEILQKLCLALLGTGNIHKQFAVSEVN